MTTHTDLEDLLRDTSATTRAALTDALTGRDLSWEQGVALSRVTGDDLHALRLVADALRARQVGDRVSYVVNRNINFTNVCVKACRFCAFSRTLRSEEGYLLDPGEVVRRAEEAWELGATEVCVQAGLAPSAHGRLYVDLCEAIKEALPEIHIHAFSPEEIKYGAGLARQTIREYLATLKAAGLGSLPGTSAEILDDDLRARISPGRITTAEWLEVVRTAHELGIPTTSTMMFGHVETAAHQMRHMARLRDLQRETGGITEFVPLSFVHQEAPLFARGEIPGVRPGPTGLEVVRLYAIARLMLGADIPNLQASWVKLGLQQAQQLLTCGVNDLGGTLINESISTSAGASHGQLVTPATLRHAVRDAGRVPVQRDTRYNALRVFSDDPRDDPAEPLDQVADPNASFGSYRGLTQDERFDYGAQRASRAREAREARAQARTEPR